LPAPVRQPSQPQRRRCVAVQVPKRLGLASEKSTHDALLHGRRRRVTHQTKSAASSATAVKCERVSGQPQPWHAGLRYKRKHEGWKQNRRRGIPSTCYQVEHLGRFSRSPNTTLALNPTEARLARGHTTSAPLPPPRRRPGNPSPDHNTARPAAERASRMREPARGAPPIPSPPEMPLGLCTHYRLEWTDGHYPRPHVWCRPLARSQG